MGYVDSALLPGETVVCRTRLHSVVLIRPVALAVLVFAAATALVIWQKLPWYLIPAALVVCGAWAAGVFVTRNASEFAITTQRVIAKTGVLRVTSLEMQLSKVEAVSTRQGIWGRLLNYGSVVIIGTGGTQQNLDLVEAPTNFARHIQTNVAPAPEKSRPPLRY